MTIDKIHSLGELTAKYNHNYRKIQVDNADPRLSKTMRNLYIFLYPILQKNNWVTLKLFKKDWILFLTIRIMQFARGAYLHMKLF